MNKILSIAWAAMFALCAALGIFFPAAEGIRKVALIVISILFFLPPSLMLYNALRAGRKGIIKRIRILCIISLSLTTVLLLTFMLVTLLAATQVVMPLAVNIVYYIFVALSAPLFCSQSMVLGLFMWGALLCATFIKPPKEESGKKSTANGKKSANGKGKSASNSKKKKKK